MEPMIEKPVCLSCFSPSFLFIPHHSSSLSPLQGHSPWSLCDCVGACCAIVSAEPSSCHDSKCQTISLSVDLYLGEAVCFRYWLMKHPQNKHWVTIAMEILCQYLRPWGEPDPRRNVTFVIFWWVKQKFSVWLLWPDNYGQTITSQGLSLSPTLAIFPHNCTKGAPYIDPLAPT